MFTTNYIGSPAKTISVLQNENEIPSPQTSQIQSLANETLNREVSGKEENKKLIEEKNDSKKTKFSNTLAMYASNLRSLQQEKQAEALFESVLELPKQDCLLDYAETLRQLNNLGLAQVTFNQALSFNRSLA